MAPELIKDFSLEAVTKKRHILVKNKCVRGWGIYGAQFVDTVINMIDHETDIVLKKQWFSAFKDTNLCDMLRKNNVTNLVVCGVTTNNCVLATSGNAVDLGFNVELAIDCTATNSKNKLNDTLVYFFHIGDKDYEKY